MRNPRKADLELLIADVDQAAESLIKALRASVRANSRLLSEMKKGGPVVEMMERLDSRDKRLSLNDALDRLEEARHRARAEMISRALGEGVSIGEIARAYGFSRQLAQRYAREAMTKAG